MLVCSAKKVKLSCLTFFVKESDLRSIAQASYEVCRKIFCDDRLNVAMENSQFGKRVRVTYNGFTLTIFDFMARFPGIRQEYIYKFVTEKRK